MAADGATATLRVSEIFHSIQGESTRAGLPTTFIRLTGCPLRCNWCDTEHAFTGGTTMTIAEILARREAEMDSFRNRFIGASGDSQETQPKAGILAKIRDFLGL